MFWIEVIHDENYFVLGEAHCTVIGRLRPEIGHEQQVWVSGSYEEAAITVDEVRGQPWISCQPSRALGMLRNVQLCIFTAFIASPAPENQQFSLAWIHLITGWWLSQDMPIRVENYVLVYIYQLFFRRNECLATIFQNIYVKHVKYDLWLVIKAKLEG